MAMAKTATPMVSGVAPRQGKLSHKLSNMIHTAVHHHHHHRGKPTAVEKSDRLKQQLVALIAASKFTRFPRFDSYP
ncbi:hypothetical protein V1264_014413 [Littorina saxatilis]|uniref:Uncharacterized protein n=1 Tax=Littorina saxatilis TaxID=31220 RepID=A0AAN9BSH7_9CAEN